MKSVQFSTIEVRGYSLCPGDHPDVNRGAPVSLDWEIQSEQSFDLEEYERRFGGKKKTHDDMIKMAYERTYMLQKSGYSMDEIEIRSKIAKKDRKNRSQTRRTMIFEPLMIVSEETRRWIAKKKSHRNKIGNESNRPIRSPSPDSIITTSTTSEMSFASNQNFLTKDLMVCNQ
jgi:hypothetical protein